VGCELARATGCCGSIASTETISCHATCPKTETEFHLHTACNKSSRHSPHCQLPSFTAICPVVRPARLHAHVFARICTEFCLYLQVQGVSRGLHTR
jgi:hypothetical protein